MDEEKPKKKTRRSAKKFKEEALAHIREAIRTCDIPARSGERMPFEDLVGSGGEIDAGNTIAALKKIIADASSELKFDDVCRSVFAEAMVEGFRARFPPRRKAEPLEKAHVLFEILRGTEGTGLSASLKPIWITEAVKAIGDELLKKQDDARYLFVFLNCVPAGGELEKGFMRGYNALSSEKKAFVQNYYDDYVSETHGVLPFGCVINWRAINLFRLGPSREGKRFGQATRIPSF